MDSTEPVRIGLGQDRANWVRIGRGTLGQQRAKPGRTGQGRDRHFISKYTTYTRSTPILSTGLCLSWLPRFCWQTNTRPSRPNQVLPSPALPCPVHLQSMPSPVIICHGLRSLALHSLTLPFPPLSGSADHARPCCVLSSPFQHWPTFCRPARSFSASPGAD